LNVGAEEVLQDVEIDQRRLAAKTVEKARAICAAHSVFIHIQFVFSILAFNFCLSIVHNGKDILK
jgi:exoribonuclease II